MERVILRHLGGSRVNQETGFPIDGMGDGITIGRDADARFGFDEADEVVSRQHARIDRTPGGFVVVDRKSANGLFVNGARVQGSSPLGHGDILRFGNAGPEVSFKFDPAPAARRSTRVESAEPKATRIDPTAPQAAPANEPNAAQAGAERPKAARAGDNNGRPAADAAASNAPGAAPAGEPQRAGRLTSVERLLEEQHGLLKKQQQVVGEQRERSSRAILNLSAASIAIAGAFGAWQYYASVKNAEASREQKVAAEVVNERLIQQKQAAEQAAKQLQARVDLPARIKEENATSTVLIEAVWRLIEPVSGKQVYHAQVPVSPDGKQTRPAYVRMADGKFEPFLSYDPQDGLAKPIGAGHSGSGFVVSENGLVMTNRHVAAAWNTSFPLPFPGVVVRPGDLKVLAELPKATPELAPELLSWVPARAKVFGARGVSDQFEVAGRNDVFNVTFPNSKLRVPAQLGTVSPEHDVALVKIDAAAGKLKPVRLNNSHGTLRAGDVVVTLGYPGISASLTERTKSQDTFLRRDDFARVTDASINQGVISKIVEGKVEGKQDSLFSAMGDIFELSINSAGEGNSGGPVFDAHGDVIGIFTGGASGRGTALSWAIPIRYGIELLNPMKTVMASK